MGGRHRRDDDYDPKQLTVEELERLEQTLKDEEDFPSRSGELE